MEVACNSGSSSGSSLISIVDVSENEAENGKCESGEKKERRRCGIELKCVKRAVRNWRKCLDSGCEEKTNLHRPCKEMRQYFCRSEKIYIEKNDRACNYHVQPQNWGEICLKTVSNFSVKIARG